MIKKIAIGFISSILIIVGIYTYVVIKRAKNSSTYNYEVMEQKIPIEHYLIEEQEKKENAKEVIREVEKPKENQEEKEEQKKENKVKLEIELKKASKNQEEKEEQKKEKPRKIYTYEEVFDFKPKEENKINKTINSRISTPLSINRATAGKKIKSEMVVDYGVDSIKGEEGYKASNENKLFRTLISMDKITVIITQKIISTLGGSLVGQVRDNVYSYMGRAVLIPKGSKIQGKYKSNNKIGEDRIQIVWERIITPNGVNIRLLGKTLDIEGASGAVGEVDNRYWERYGMPLTITTATNIGTMAISNLTQKIPSVQSQDILEQGAEDVSNIGKAILQEQMKITPIITIEAGDIVFVSPLKDIYFPKPKDGEIMVEYFDRLEEKNTEVKEDK